MKKLLSIFLVSLMCIQLLPIKEVGKLLFNNQIVEEHMEGGNSSKGPKLTADLGFLRYAEMSALLNPELFLSTRNYNYYEEIPASPIQEIQTPPPNAARA